MLREGGVRYLAHAGGTAPPEIAPFDVNHEVLRTFQFDPAMDADAEIERIARGWAGERFAGTLCEAWRLAEEAILAYPNVTPLYSTMGFVWYRLWVRPLVPNIEAIEARDRAYYQDFMCTTPHNPNNVDLSRDVLLVASVRGVDPLGRIVTPPKRSREQDEALEAMNTLAFHEDDLEAFKRLG